MSNFFPLFIDLALKRCLVVGGGKVAERKIKELLKHNADVLVVSPELTRSLKDLLSDKKFSYISSGFSEKHIDGVFLIIDATGSPEVNKKVFRVSRDRKILVNIVNEPDKSDFFTPAIFSRGDLKIAVSTSGNSPALAAGIKRELFRRYGPEYGLLLDLLGNFRGKILKRFESGKIRKKVFQSIVESDIIELISKGELKKAELFCEEIIRAAAEKRGSPDAADKSSPRSSGPGIFSGKVK